MVGATLATLSIAAVASLLMAWTIGAGSSGSTPFAPAVGANAISVMRAGFFVGILGFLGAVLQGANVSEAVGRELIHGVQLTPLAATVGLLTAAALVTVGVFSGYPIATAFTVTGAVVGVGLALGGQPAWAKYRQIATLWVLVPVVGGSIAYATASLLRHEAIGERYAVPLLGGAVGAVFANVEFALLGPGGAAQSIAATLAPGLPLPPFASWAFVSGALALAVTAALALEMRESTERGQRRFLLALGALVAFSAGGSQVGLAIGPLLPLLDPALPGGVSVTAVLVFGGIGLLAGSWTGAPRMIKAISQDYSSLGPRRSIAALVPAFLIAQTAVLFGIPVSFNEIVVSAIVGSGAAASGSDVGGHKMGYTVAAWVASLVLALVLGYAAYRLLAP